MSGKMGVHKNKHVEEWNGKREMTEKTFELDKTTVPWLLATCVAFPVFVWKTTSAELERQPEFKGRVM